MRSALVLAPNPSDPLFNRRALRMREAKTSMERVQAAALLRRAIDHAARGWSLGRAAMEIA